MATSIMTPALTATDYLVSELRAARGWQRLAIAETTETAINDVARWDEHDLDHLEPYQRRRVETILSVDSTLPWWSRGHA